MNFEQKIALLVLAKNPKERAELVTKFSNDKEFFVTYNAKYIPLKQYMELNAEKFRPVAIRAKQIRDGIKNRGWTDKKYQKYLGEIPDQLFLERPEFSAYLPQKELQKNIENFLRDYPQFRVDK